MKNIILGSLVIIIVFMACSNNEEAAPESNPQAPTSFTCTGTTSAKGSRQIGFDILDASETGSFNENLSSSLSLGQEFLNLHLHWTSIETSPSTFSDPGGALAALEATANAQGIKIVLIISPIDIPGKSVPADLTATSFSNATMAVRFNALVDYITAIISPTNILSFSIGNEIDVYDWTGNGDSPADYGTFLAAVKTHINGKGIETAFTGTLKGLTSGTWHGLGTWRALATVVDKIHVTYYPINGDFSVQDPSVVATDFANLDNEFWGAVAAYNKPLFLQEVGYQTSSSSNSSEEKQAQFFCNFFKEWDTYAAHMPYASILRFVDNGLVKSQQTAIDYGLTGNTAFIEYIRTLGIRTYDGKGTDKQAYSIIAGELSKRGW